MAKSFTTIFDEPDRWHERECPICHVGKGTPCVDAIARSLLTDGSVHMGRLILISGGDRDTNEGREEREIARRTARDIRK